jgi:feruloyl esterase
MRICWLLAAGVAAAHWAAGATCESIATVQLQRATVTAAVTRAAGEFAPEGGRGVHVAVGFCRVALTLTPSVDSNVHVEIWMPSTGWNGKFQGIGNGGFAGAIDYETLARAVAAGYAAAETDTGHQAGGTDAKWALGHTGKIADFGHRAIHETAVAAKAVVHGFYGEAPKHSYFNACSNGGRQGLMEAQRYPEDYDGIVAGAPAYFWSHLLTTAIFDMQALAGPGYIPASKLPAIGTAVLAECDTKDGVKDGLIENPAACHFDPGVLLCKGDETASCLTAPQVDALRKLYAGPGANVLPGYSPGGEADAGGWAAWIMGPSQGASVQSAFGLNFFRYMAYGDAAWDFHTSTLEENLRAAEKLSNMLDATSPDLSRFRARGGKLILYHGWSDPGIPPQGTADYYNSVVKKMGSGPAGEFVRLFMAPGMGHCGGGSGPNVFGQMGVPAGDADHDVDAAIERWVEHAQAPERIVATKYKGAGPSRTVERTRPLCAYPATAHWDGKGSIDEAASFVCK